MHHFMFGRRFAGRLLAGLCVMVPVALLIASVWGFQATSIEAGPLEVAQEYFLVATIALYALAARYDRGAGRMAAVAAAVLATVFFLRELELPATGPVSRYLGSELFRWHEAAAVLLVALPYLALRWRLVGEHLRYLRDLSGWPFALVALLLVVGDRFEHVATATPFLATFIEESCELAAYLVFAATGLQVLSNAARLGVEDDTIFCHAGR